MAFKDSVETKQKKNHIRYVNLKNSILKCEAVNAEVLHVTKYKVSPWFNLTTMTTVNWYLFSIWLLYLAENLCFLTVKPMLSGWRKYFSNFKNDLKINVLNSSNSIWNLYFMFKVTCAWQKHNRLLLGKWLKKKNDSSQNLKLEFSEVSLNFK